MWIFSLLEDFWDGLSGEGRILVSIGLWNFTLSAVHFILQKIKERWDWVPKVDRWVCRGLTILAWLSANRRNVGKGK